MSSIFSLIHTKELNDTEIRQLDCVLEALINRESSISLMEMNSDESKISGRLYADAYQRTAKVLFLPIFAYLISGYIWLYHFCAGNGNSVEAIFRNPISVLLVLYITILILLPIPRVVCKLNIKKAKCWLSNRDQESHKEFRGITKSFLRLIKSILSKLVNWVCETSIVFVPFSFKTIWIWTFVFGIATVFSLQDLDVISSQLEVVEDIARNREEIFLLFFNKLSLGVLSSSVIAIISYIATNVITELHDLRRAYVNSLNQQGKELKSAEDIVHGLTSNSKKLEGHAVSLYDLIAKSLEFQNFKEDLETKGDVIKALGNDFSNALAQFPSTVSAVVHHHAYFNEEETGSGSNLSIKDALFLSLLSSYRSLITDDFKRYGEMQSVVTPFSNLGVLSAELIRNMRSWDSADDYEFYALQAMNPEEFIGDYFAEYDTENNIARRDQWRLFVNENIIRNHVNRYFVCVEPNDKSLYSDKFENEFISKTTLIDQLKSEKSYYVDSKKIAELRNQQGEAGNRDVGSSVSKDPLISDKPGVFENESEVKLGSLLGDIIHDEENASCRIRYFNTEDCNRLLFEDVKEGNYTETSFASGDSEKRCKKVILKPVDYLALRKKNGHDENPKGWIFCVKTLYDRELNAAIVKLCYPKGDNDVWNSICLDLDEIFFHGQNEPILHSICRLDNQEKLCSECLNTGKCTRNGSKVLSSILPINKFSLLN